MRTKCCIGLFVTGLLCHYSFAQSNLPDRGVYVSYVKNIRDSTLVTGFYNVTSKYYQEPYDFNHHVEYKQHIEDIPFKNPGIFSKKATAHYVHSSYSIVAEEKFGFIRNLKGTDRVYQVNPFPVSAKDNIIRVYDFKNYERDSTFDIGLTIKLNFCIDSNLCANRDMDIEKCPLTGLVINNELVAVSRTYYKNEAPNKSSSYVERYFVFVFPKQTEEQVESYKKQLFQQTLYKHEN